MSQALPDDDLPSGTTAIEPLPSPHDDPVSLPITPVTTRVLDTIGRVEPVAVANHSVRSFLFARFIAHDLSLAAGSDYDKQLLFFSTTLHDVGLANDAKRKERFEVEGADRAAELLTSCDLPASDIDEVWEAIALHTSIGIAERRGTLCMLTQSGIAYDFGGAVGPGPAPDAVSNQHADLIHTNYPRLSMVRSLTDAVVTHAAAAPQNRPPYTIPGDLHTERGSGDELTRLERAVGNARWPE